MSRAVLFPPMAWARIGSAVRFAAAAAIGAAPIRITASAATAPTDRALAVASTPPSAFGASGLSRRPRPPLRSASLPPSVPSRSVPLPSEPPMSSPSQQPLAY